MYNLSQVAIQRVFEGAPTRAYLYVIPTDTSNGFIINEENYLKDILLEELRYVPEQGIIGGVVARRLSGNFNNIDQNFSILDREMILYIGVDTDDTPTTEYVEYGTFIVQRPTDDKVNDNTYFEALDYMCKLNLTWEDRLTYPCTIKELYDDLCEQSGLISATTSFRNMDFIVENNQFTGGESRRDVLRAIAQIAFSWARINEQNQICIDFDLNMSDSSSKNLLNPQKFIQKTYAGVTMTITKNGLFLNGTATGSYEFFFSLCYSDWDNLKSSINNANGDYYLSSNLGTDKVVCFTRGTESPQTRNKITITDTNKLKNLTFRIVVGVTYYNELLELQLERGSIATEYTPFGITQVITNDEYKDFKSNPDEYGPVNVIVLRNSQVEGENITIRDEESIAAPRGKNILNLLGNGITITPTNVEVTATKTNSISFNGTAGSNRYVQISGITLPAGKYIFNRLFSVTDESAVVENITGLFRVINAATGTIIANITTDTTTILTITEETNVRIGIYLAGNVAIPSDNGITFSNLMIMRLEDTITSNTLIDLSNADNISLRDVDLISNTNKAITIKSTTAGTFRYARIELGLLPAGTYYMERDFTITEGTGTSSTGIMRAINRPINAIIKDITANLPSASFILEEETDMSIIFFISETATLTDITTVTFRNINLYRIDNTFEAFVPNGETELVIADNPFAYTQAKRTELIEAGRALFGLRYMPISASLPIGFFWLNNTDKLRFSDMLGRNYDTFLFNHTIQYIGVTTDEVETPAQTSTETKYQFLPTMQSAVRRTEIIVDKHENQITSLTEETTELGGKLTIVEQKVDGTQTSVEIRGGNNKIKNSPQVFGFEDLLNQNTRVPITGYFQGTPNQDPNFYSIRVNAIPITALNGQKYTARLQSNPNIEMMLICYKDNTSWVSGTMSPWSGTNNSVSLTTTGTDIYITLNFRKIDGSPILVDEVVSLFPTLEYGLDNSGATTITDTNISQFTVSKVGVKIIGTMLKTGIDLTIGQPYTLSMLYSNTAGNAIKIEIVENNTITILETTDAASLRKIEHTFTATGTSMEIRFYSAGETFLYADLMLNEGDTSLPWQPSIGETIGVVIQMNYDGLTVSSYLSATRTIMDANGFRIVDTMNNLVLRADSEKVLAKNIESQGYIKTGKWRQYTQTVNGYEHFILVRED